MVSDVASDNSDNKNNIVPLNQSSLLIVILDGHLEEIVFAYIA